MMRAWQEAPPREFDTYYLVLLTSGGNTDIDPDRKQKAFMGHQAHMLRCYEAGELLTPAPVEGSGELDVRGILIYRGDLGEARISEILANDPMIREGVLAARVTRMHTPKGIIAWK